MNISIALRPVSLGRVRITCSMCCLSEDHLHGSECKAASHALSSLAAAMEMAALALSVMLT